jgi:8-oxo-dGTP diphosphatase
MDRVMARGKETTSREKHCYAYPRPALTADVVLFAVEGPALRVLLIERRDPPFAGRWALPGGFVDIDEDLPAAASRELREETGIRAQRLVQLGACGKVERDPRGRTVSVVFLGLHRGRVDRAMAGDDASAVRWFDSGHPPRLAFDHRTILRDALARLREMAESDRLLRLLPRRLVAGDIAALYRAVLGQDGRDQAWTSDLLRRGLLRTAPATRGSRSREPRYERTAR